MGTLERLIARHDAMANDEQKLKTAKLKAEIELLKKTPAANEKAGDMEAAIDEAWRKRSEQNAQS
jgi:ribosome-associated translation inhibitor RaiA